MNCTYFYTDNRIYANFQNIALLIMIFVGVFLNLLTITVTLNNQAACRCSTARLFLSSYAGNLCGLASMALNGVYDPKKGVPTINCKSTVDYHFLLYLGFTVNMVILVSSTYNRYQGISNLNKKFNGVESSKNLFFRYALPSWIFSIFISSLFVLLEFYKKIDIHPYFVCAMIGIIPMLTCITLNVLLKFFLLKMMKNAEMTQQSDSLKNISVAISMLRLTAICHAIYLVTGLLVIFFLNKYGNNTTVFLILDWISRMLYDLMFTVEAKAFLIKHAAARKGICRFFKGLYKKKDSYTSVISKVTETDFTS